ncbi:MAG: homogentisate phytyltransferase, partial [Calditrichia bacterium]
FIAAAETGFEHLGILPLLFALLSTWAGNIYIVGLNQLQDVEIDRINKPFLPLASGEYSLRTGWLIVVISGIAALGISASQGSFLFLVIAVSLFIGTAYSLPPLRLKRFPFWAAISILVVRGIVVNLGLFLYYISTVGENISIPEHVWALTIFFVGFGIAIALFKDIPDIRGDRLFKIRTLAIRVGPKNIFSIGLYVLFACYLFLIAVQITSLIRVHGPSLIGSHLIILSVLWYRSRRVKPDVPASMTSFYMFVWRLFFIEYIIFPLFCWLR